MKKNIKKKSRFRLLLTIICIVGVLVAAYFYFWPTRPNLENAKEVLAESGFGWKYPVAKFPSVGPAGEDLLAYSNIRDPGGEPRGLPVRLKIPIIGVNSAIEDAYITADGRMDVPAGTTNVAWFALGPYPGKTGSSVIGGHYGKYEDNDGATVFYNLDKLKVGDKVYIEDDKGATLAFIVRSIKLFDRNADSTSVFTSEDGLSHLNLITCEGIWNKQNDTYPDRRVVFTDAIPSEEATGITKQPLEVKPTLPATSISSSSSITTPSAVLSDSPSTVSDEDSESTPTEKTQTTAWQTVSFYGKSVFENKVDGTVTVVLIFSILFMIYKVVRK